MVRVMDPASAVPTFMSANNAPMAPLRIDHAEMRASTAGADQATLLGARRGTGPTVALPPRFRQIREPDHLGLDLAPLHAEAHAAHARGHRATDQAVEPVVVGLGGLDGPLLHEAAATLRAGPLSRPGRRHPHKQRRNARVRCGWCFPSKMGTSQKMPSRCESLRAASRESESLDSQACPCARPTLS